LIAEDDSAVVDIVRTVLAGDGHELLDAADGDAALAVIAANPELDLVILDIMMPGKSGLEVAEELRSNGGRPSPPIIFLTAKDEDHDREFGFHTGAVEYITKPFKPELLRATGWSRSSPTSGDLPPDLSRHPARTKDRHPPTRLIRSGIYSLGVTRRPVVADSSAASASSSARRPSSPEGESASEPRRTPSTKASSSTRYAAA
jgi:CheY-like chemotaxis protein